MLYKIHTISENLSKGYTVKQQLHVAWPAWGIKSHDGRYVASDGQTTWNRRLICPLYYQLIPYARPATVGLRAWACINIDRTGADITAGLTSFPHSDADFAAKNSSIISSETLYTNLKYS